MQIKLEHKYFRQYLAKQEKVNNSRYTNTYKEIQTLKYVILNCKHYRDEQNLIERTLEVKVLTIKILFLIQKDIACALNYLKKTRIAY